MSKKYILIAIIVIIMGTSTGVCGGGGGCGGGDPVTKKYGVHGSYPTSANNPPPGTTINESLSEYYNRPVATGDGITFWYIGGYGWFSQSEMLNLPSDSLMYDISPYDSPQ